MNVEVIKGNNRVYARRKGGNAKGKLRVAAYCRVSTNDEDQLNSYRSQVTYYTELIKKKDDWLFAGIYADEGITGTQVSKREEFQRLINDCMNGEVDMVITKSISRFARNTLDTLKYVRMLKAKNIAVFFEEENINTLTMDGELLLVVLSSVAQQEVENISANVKKGLKMKMQRGEMVGFQGCLGYDYDPISKTISVNEEEAEVVRYIFRRYLQGAGGSVISKELRNLGYKTKRGGTAWPESTVIGIIKNEKYKGDLLMGKTFTVDPITKRRLANFGEEDRYYLAGHHEPIISEEDFEKAQMILRRRSYPRKTGDGVKRELFTRKYAFSCLIKCGFCGGTLTRRCWHSGTTHSKVVWQCVEATKGGKKFCPDSKGVEEIQIQRAFVESYKLLCTNEDGVLEEFLERVEKNLSEDNSVKQAEKARRDIAALEGRRAKLVDMRLDEVLSRDDYELKYSEICAKIEKAKDELAQYEEAAATYGNVRERIAAFRKTLEDHRGLEEFDRYVFESIVEKVIVGGYDEDGNKDPEQITFVYKSGFKDSLTSHDFRSPRKSYAARKNSYHSSGYEAEKVYQKSGGDTRRDVSRPFQKNSRQQSWYFEVKQILRH